MMNSMMHTSHVKTRYKCVMCRVCCRATHNFKYVATRLMVNLFKYFTCLTWQHVQNRNKWADKDALHLEGALLCNPFITVYSRN